MTVLVDSALLDARRAVARASLAPLAQSLKVDLDALPTAATIVPVAKASYGDGHCPMDGTLLDFDPASPRRHRCPRCKSEFELEAGNGMWLYWFQLWLAERVVHASLLASLGFGEPYAKFALTRLDRYALQYERYPNADNVLGPSRPFFSTYLESIWLLQLCVAVDLLESGGVTEAQGIAGEVRSKIVVPSSRLIASYDEGRSNRQVWNTVAQMAAARLLGDDESFARQAEALITHVDQGLLADGTWYEGENYHLFAHRGLWYGVTMCEQAGYHLPPTLIERFQEGFATPFLTALPDLMLPARKDSQYGVSLRQWRFAEWCELGLARAHDARLAGMLDRLYDESIPVGETGRALSTAEAERNAPASGLRRSELGWKSLLFARSELPPAPATTALASTVLPEQGIAVARRNGGRVFAALDYGQSGGGHGHPDRLNLLLAVGDTHWLEDMGTGSYADASLFWYRSTLAHNAPFIDGESQPRVAGELLAFDERESYTLMHASARLARDVVVERAVLVADSYAVDHVSWDAARETQVDLPVHVDLTFAAESALQLRPDTLVGGSRPEDGFTHVTAAYRGLLTAGVTYALQSTGGMRAALTCEVPTEVWRCVAPGPPGELSRRFLLLRARGAIGSYRMVWSWGAITEQADIDPAILAAERRPPSPCVAAPPPQSQPRLAPVELHSGVPDVFSLAEPHYRQSELTWREAGEPSGTVTIEWQPQGIDVDIVAWNVDTTFVAPAAKKGLGNEPADIDGASVQLYFAAYGSALGVRLLPDRLSGEVHMRPIATWPSDGSFVITAGWDEERNGYSITARIARADGAPMPRAFSCDVIVNEMPVARNYRRGQLVMSGAHGEYVYLRGDRHDIRRLIPFVIADG
jgi:hypothetical protein